MKEKETDAKLLDGEPVEELSENENKHSESETKRKRGKHRHHSSRSGWGRRRRKEREERLRRRRALKKAMKKNRIQLICFGIIILLLAAILILTIFPRNSSRKAASTQQSSVGLSSRVALSVPVFEAKQSLVPVWVKEYLSVGYSEKTQSFLEEYRAESTRLDVGKTVLLSYEVEELPEGSNVQSARLEVSESPKFTDPYVFELNNIERSKEVPYLKTATQYYYRFTVRLSNDTTAAIQGEFETEDTPRILSIDGLVNVRDIGGWVGADGNVIRQGLLIRGSELDGAVEENYSVSEMGLFDSLTILGIRTDMDLRSPDDNEDGLDALGKNVRHIYYDAEAYEQIFKERGKEAVRQIFSDLANPAHYPVYLHCTYGMDRTGTVCYLLEALLGVSDEDLLAEYGLSALCHADLAPDGIQRLISGLQAVEGNSTQEKAENYLLSCGVTPEEIEMIRGIFYGTIPVGNALKN